MQINSLSNKNTLVFLHNHIIYYYEKEQSFKNAAVVKIYFS